MIRRTWSPEHDELAIALWKAGKSGSEIAAVLGITRNAALGRLRRLGMTRHNGVHRAGRFPRATPPRKPAAKKQQRKPFKFNGTPIAERPPPRLDRVRKAEPKTGEPKSKRQTIYQLTNHICHYPDPNTDKPPYTYCGNDALPRSMWCEFHYKVCVAGRVTSAAADRHFDRMVKASGGGMSVTARHSSRHRRTG